MGSRASALLALGLVSLLPARALAANVLYCNDYNLTTDRMGEALTSLGSVLTLTSTSDMGACESYVAGAAWDLVIVAIQNMGYSTPNFQAYVAAGGLAIMQDWTMEGTLGARFEVSYVTTNQASVTVTWAPFASGLMANPFKLTNPGWGIYSMVMSPTGGGVSAATFASGSAVVLGNSGRTIANGFLTDTGDENATVLYFNEISYLLDLVTPTDLDGDGYSVDDGDCDDDNAAVNPGADEACNGIDDDCDGDIDEAGAVGALPWYADGDGDGFGDPLDEVLACEAPEGYITNNADCDDSNAAVYPGATEVCNGIDDDCDARVDERGAVGESVWYADADGDLYIRLLSTVISCTAPSGYIARSSSLGNDCDDGNAAVNPGAEELCNGIDDDCDGDIDEDSSADATRWYADDDKDGYRDPDRSLVSCARPLGFLTPDESLGDDCDDTDPAVHGGATEVCNGIDDDCDGEIDEAGASGGGTWYADADADGWTDEDVFLTACVPPAGYREASALADCDDANGAIHPGATERCNGVDDDCDGAIDEAGAVGERAFLSDADDDGYGLSGTRTFACDERPGTVLESASLGEDCDDANAAVNPGAEERCNGIDDDCDGDVDETGALGELAWYEDADEDGYGDADTLVRACEPPEGYVEEGLDGFDCDDTRADIHPGAPEDDCTDPTDYNCDGSTGYTDADLDRYAACEDCNDKDAAVNPGAMEACNGFDDDCDGEIDEAGALGEITWFADADGDDYADATVSLTSCETGEGWIDEADIVRWDCDDTDPSVYPEATEIPGDGIDQDCDGQDEPLSDDTGPLDTDDGKGAYSGAGGCGCIVTETPARKGLFPLLALGVLALLRGRREEFVSKLANR